MTVCERERDSHKDRERERERERFLPQSKPPTAASLSLSTEAQSAGLGGVRTLMYQSAVVRRLFTERCRSAEEEILREREREKRRGRVRRGEVVVGVREGQEVRERETGYICSHVKDFTFKDLVGKN